MVELLTVLEERITQLLMRFDELSKAHEKIVSSHTSVLAENKKLIKEVDLLSNNNVQLHKELDHLKKAVAQEGAQREELSKERGDAKRLLEDLIRNIESSSALSESQK